ncbi:Domain_of Conserved hypothetical protein function DUF4476 [Hexamita inflata]|uniref:DUF4476 domain-containing protein n=1 Tax=Hexamita inflata TaxID=28002 RepID=A0AA86QV82_9EUKA|nr:Domain of Conserved hypothetical protein function DUF4476 [Hexamita inflata]
MTENRKPQLINDSHQFAGTLTSIGCQPQSNVIQFSPRKAQMQWRAPRESNSIPVEFIDYSQPQSTEKQQALQKMLRSEALETHNSPESFKKMNTLREDRVLAETEFTRLYSDFRIAIDKIKYLNEALQGVQLTSTQFAQLLTLIPADEQKIVAVRQFYKNVQNILNEIDLVRILSVFIKKGDRIRVKRIIGVK